MELTGNIRLGSHTSTHYEEMIIISRGAQIHEGDVPLDIQVLRCNQKTTARETGEGRGIEVTAQASVAQYMNHDTFLADFVTKSRYLSFRSSELFVKVVVKSVVFGAKSRDLSLRGSDLQAYPSEHGLRRQDEDHG